MIGGEIRSAGTTGAWRAALPELDGEGLALMRAQLARMSDTQLRRFLHWLDQRGAPVGKSFAVHQADPRDPGSRDLIELQVTAVAIREADQSKRKLRLSRA